MKLGGFEVGTDRPLFLIAGPCVIESEALVLETSPGRMKEITRALGIPFIFKASLRQGQPLVGDELPRPGHRRGLRDPREVQRQLGVPVLTDVHEDTPLDEVAAVVDVLQTPAFLCRQTNFILNVAAPGQARQHQEGPVPVAVGNEQRRRQGARRPATSRSWSASAASASATTTWSSDMRSLAVMRAHRLPGGVRRHAFGAAAGRAGQCLGRAARVRAGAGARGGGRRRRRRVHGNASRSGQGAVATARTPGRSAAWQSLLDDADASSTQSSKRGPIEESSLN